MKKVKNFYISFGKLSDEDRTWDIQFWQTSTPKERFLAVSSLAKHAYKVKTGRTLPSKIDLTHIISGKIRYDRQ